MMLKRSATPGQASTIYSVSEQLQHLASVHAITARTCVCLSVSLPHLQAPLDVGRERHGRVIAGNVLCQRPHQPDIRCRVRTQQLRIRGEWYCIRHDNFVCREEQRVGQASHDGCDPLRRLLQAQGMSKVRIGVSG